MKNLKLILLILFFVIIAGRSNFAFAQNSNGVINLGAVTSSSVRRLHAADFVGHP